LRVRVDALCRCDEEAEVGALLPSLIRDLHTSIAAGRDTAELLPLAAWLHTQATVPWLRLAEASTDLSSLTIMLARRLPKITALPLRWTWSLRVPPGF
jgi:hypothetical protein